MPSPQDVEFIGHPPEGGGFEALAGEAETLPSPEQKARATDLFLRGALTAEELAKARASRGGFEAIIGRPNFLPAVFLEIGAAVSRSTCLVRTSGVDYLGRSGSWSGTGFLLGPSVLVTNHHVLNSPEVAAAAGCVFNYQLGADGEPLATRTFHLRPDRLFLTSPTQGGLDYTFVWLDGEPGRDFGTARVSRQAFVIAEQEFANVISHPQGRMKEVCVQENEVQWQDDLVVHYTSDTEPGSSGASVCNNNWQLVALHHASKQSNVPNYSILNEGIKLSAIAADLERLARSGTAAAAAAGEVLALFGGTDERLGFFGTLGRRPPTGPEGGFEVVRNTFQGTDQDIDVGFWNVEWLTKHYDVKTPVVAKVMHALNLDVWSLEESSPNAAAEVARELKEAYGLDFGHAAAEPESADGKQSCTLLWNKETVDVVPEEWGEPIETWLQARSPDFDDLGLGGFEAVHGKIFDRYPALFKVTAKQPTAGGTFVFYLVPVHLKAMDEGSLRRKMASKILAAAIQKKIEGGAAADWVIGGDFNAALATEDFANLVSGGLVPVSAEDEQGGAFSYIKRPKSLIDHIFLSPNLARRYREDDYVIVAVEKTFPHYVAEVSDHRPVLVRLSLNGSGAAGGGFEKTATDTDRAALDELRQRLAAAPAGDGAEEDGGLEARRRRKPAAHGPADLADRTGYSASFLGKDHPVPLPGLPAALAGKAVVVNRQKSGTDRFALPYTHYSVVMNGQRRLPFYSAVNIDGNQLRRVPRSNNWFLDPRIPAAAQSGSEVYRGSDLDRGHMTRRLDPVWGAAALANQADADTFCYANACPQHKDLNQKEWQHLEDYVLDNAGAHELKVCVITGPVLRESDRPFRGVLLPEEFWKVVVMVKADTGELSATGYVLSQRDLIAGFEAAFAFGAFKTYQVTLRRMAEMTELDFGKLPECDPLDRARGGMEAIGPEVVLIGGPGDLVF
jgi:DNA/RNA endonuclease G (NUC1)/V8-like Glu-specific endopeptidase